MAIKLIESFTNNMTVVWRHDLRKFGITLLLIVLSMLALFLLPEKLFIVAYPNLVGIWYLP